MGSKEHTHQKRNKLYEISLEQDIRYRGPLTYRHFKILGWLCIACSQVVFLLTLAGKAAPEVSQKTAELQSVLSFFAPLSVSFLLFANFSTILTNRNGYKKQLMINGIVSGAIILVYLFVYYRYILGVLGTFAGGRQQGEQLLMESLSSDSSGGILSLNLFLDLFLCTAFMFFLNYEPVRFFSGKRKIWFRLFAVLPVLYEAVSIMLKYLSFEHIITIAPACYPLFPTKPPMMFLVFLVLAVFLKTRERRFLKHGKTKTEYQRFLKTKRNSWHVSVFAATVVLIAGILDLLILILFTGVQVEGNVSSSDTDVVMAAMQNALGLGIGNSAALIPMAPILLLFSYNKDHRNSLVDLLIPVGGVILIVLVYVEGIYHALMFLPGFLGL